MSSRLHVTLNEVVEVASEPLSEAELWALLKLAAIAVKTSRNGPNNGNGIIRAPPPYRSPYSWVTTAPGYSGDFAAVPWREGRSVAWSV